jgi:hypothetical protein
LSFRDIEGVGDEVDPGGRDHCDQDCAHTEQPVSD